MARILMMLSAVVLYIATIHAASYERTLDMLLREFKELEVQSRESQIAKRVAAVMTLLEEPLERSQLFERGEEGTVCSDGVETTCSGSVHCDDDGTVLCNPLCDSSSHGGIAHFYCKCKPDSTAQLCDVARKEAEAYCATCTSDALKGKFCYVTSSSSVGYYCYDQDYKIMKLDESDLDESDEGEGEKLGRIARGLTEYLEENL